MNVYEIVTEKIVGLLEAGVVPWRKPWASSELTPRNAVSKRPYRGINRFLLAAMPYADPFWLTYRQASELGGNVRKGEKSTIVIFWKRGERTEQNDAGEDETRSTFILRYYRVFNIAQCDLPQAFLDKLPKPSAEREHSPVEAGEAIIANMPNRPTMATGQYACYQPKADTVVLPPRERFTRGEDYYSTAFHELGHSTGHQSRLSRDAVMGTVEFGSGDYSKEELVAEMTAAFLCAESGVSPVVIENQASYIKSWLGKLRGEPRWLVMAAAQAQKASDYILDRRPDCEPAE